MAIYIDTLAEFIEQEREENEATRQDFEKALDQVFGKGE